MLRVGYIDEDEGQRNSFHHLFKDEFEVILFEITEETNAENLVDEVLKSAIDVLVLDFRLDENGLVDFNADKLVEGIQAINLFYPLVVLTSHEVDALDHLENAHLVNGKDDMLDSKIDIFKQKLRSIALDNKRKIESAEAELKKLEEKRINGGFDSKEEDRYVELSSFLDQTISAKGRVSRSFYSEHTNKKLDDLIGLAEQMLNKMPDQE
ncbi:hypothetical protein [Jiulongibacter sediminis]|uniref:Response regulatory domain-containing protein n=1 Tax=Jiulongibacter sediminis TaxID=1605367 RepID=A0A0N8HA91_9BACT|nr:hypothetical protein [Jiulongibacter sediminis]KPM49516.1 hypothetical protein AFM12_02620 [Jiulongibacter sediminis]TBX26559.1 hypothetical protein TK44_02625 [Jiulongibacter sediminis]